MPNETPQRPPLTPVILDRLRGLVNTLPVLARAHPPYCGDLQLLARHLPTLLEDAETVETVQAVAQNATCPNCGAVFGRIRRAAERRVS